MKYLVDVDGVLADFVGASLEIINAIGGSSYSPEDVVRWEIEDLLPADKRDAFFWHVQRPGFCARLAPLRSEMHFVRELQRLGHEVVVVTSPWKSCPTWIPERTAWVHRYLGDLEIHHTHDKAAIDGDALIDDKPSHVLSWATHHPNGTAFLFNAPYNQDAPGVVRINSIRELLDGQA